MADVSSLSKTDRNLWNSIISEAMANLKYNAFSYKAMEEGYPEVAQVFQEVAGAETIHGINHLRVAGDIKSTAENLRTVMEGEAKEAATLYPRMIKDALDEGRVDAAETLTIAMDREQHHLEVFSRALDLLETKQNRLREASTTQIEGHLEPTPARFEAPPRIEAYPEQSPAYRAAARELDRERWRVAAFGRIREVVFGAQDGLLSTVALVTAVAVSGVGGTTGVLVAGLAAALAGMVSMASGSYLSSKAESDVQKAEIAKEAEELDAHPAEELAELVVMFQREGLTMREAQDMAEHIASDRDLWLRTMVEKELGLSSEVTANPIKDAMVMGLAFIVAAMVPIFPFFFLEGYTAIGTSSGAALLGLFALGVGKGQIVRKSPLLQGLEILLVGAVAAAIGYGLGVSIPWVFGI
jgi:VIT1/CCC1 family predicted Fe2+/Mn2+ transporter/rubrerythrin